MEIEKKNIVLSKAYTDSQGMISLADSKANISLTIQSFLLTITLGFSILSNIFTHLSNLIELYPELVLFYIIVLIIFIIMSIIGILCTIGVYYPREAKEESEKVRKGLFYFKHVLSYGTSDKYFEKIEGLSEQTLMEEYSRQIFQLASIADRKFRFVKFSILFLIINMSLNIFFLILSCVINVVIGAI
jgi:hypothetical protein